MCCCCCCCLGRGVVAGLGSVFAIQGPHKPRSANDFDTGLGPHQGAYTMYCVTRELIQPKTNLLILRAHQLLNLQF